MQLLKSNLQPKFDQNTGKVGESLAAKFLEQRGFRILDRNYLKAFGEIDVVAEKHGIVHFAEVKTVSHETTKQLEWAVAHETWRPEEQVHHRKLHQISKAVQAWLNERRYTGNFQIDVIGIRIVPRETFCSINWIQNVITE